MTPHELRSVALPQSGPVSSGTVLPFEDPTSPRRVTLQLPVCVRVFGCTTWLAYLTVPAARDPECRATLRRSWMFGHPSLTTLKPRGEQYADLISSSDRKQLFDFERESYKERPYLLCAGL